MDSETHPLPHPSKKKIKFGTKREQKKRNQKEKIEKKAGQEGVDKAFYPDVHLHNLSHFYSCMLGDIHIPVSKEKKITESQIKRQRTFLSVTVLAVKMLDLLHLCPLSHSCSDQ